MNCSPDSSPAWIAVKAAADDAPPTPTTAAATPVVHTPAAEAEQDLLSAQEDDSSHFIREATRAFVKSMVSSVLDDETREMVRSQLVSPLFDVFMKQVYPYVVAAGIIVSILLLLSAVTVGLLILRTRHAAIML